MPKSHVPPDNTGTTYIDHASWGGYRVRYNDPAIIRCQQDRIENLNDLDYPGGSIRGDQIAGAVGFEK